MFVRNGQALGSILHKDVPRAERPTKTARIGEPQPRKRGRPRKEAKRFEPQPQPEQSEPVEPEQSEQVEPQQVSPEPSDT